MSDSRSNVSIAHMPRADGRGASVVRTPGRREHAHSECVGECGDPTADRAESEDAECLALELDEEGTRPLSGAHSHDPSPESDALPPA